MVNGPVRFILSVFTLAMLVVSFSAPALAWTSAGVPAKEDPSSPRTVEPSPPFSLEILLQELQKNASGGVASIQLKLLSQMNLGEVIISAKLPGTLTFADGSKSKSWVRTLNSDEAVEIPAEVLVDKDGKYVITATMLGQLKGKPVRRGAAYKLLVGVDEKQAGIKNGAVEYQGVRGRVSEEP